MKRKRNALTNFDPGADLDIQLEWASLLSGLCRPLQPVSVVGRTFAYSSGDTCDRALALAAWSYKSVIIHT